MAELTANYASIDPEDGWVAVTAAAVSFIKIRSSTGHGFYVTCANSAPAATVVGFKHQNCDEPFWCDTAVPTGYLYYVRTVENQPKGNTISVFSIPAA